MIPSSGISFYICGMTRTRGIWQVGTPHTLSIFHRSFFYFVLVIVRIFYSDFFLLPPHGQPLTTAPADQTRSERDGQTWPSWQYWHCHTLRRVAHVLNTRHIAFSATWRHREPSKRSSPHSNHIRMTAYIKHSWTTSTILLYAFPTFDKQLPTSLGTV